MARRKNGLPDVLQEVFLFFPWWVGPPAVLAVLVGGKVIGAALASGDSPFLLAAGSLVTSLSPFASILVAFIWSVALVQKGYRRWLLSSRAGIQSIRELSWRDFELLVGEALRRDGYTVEELGGRGPDGGIDLIARRPGEKMIVQCKHWRSWDVGVRIVREVFGVMTAESATSAMIVTTGRFSRAALAFAEGKPLRLLDGDALAAFVASVRSPPTSGGSGTEEALRAVESLAAAPPPTGPPNSLPPCPRCGATMVVRTARKGANTGEQFLGCSNFPRCKGTRELPK